MAFTIFATNFSRLKMTKILFSHSLTQPSVLYSRSAALSKHSLITARLGPAVHHGGTAIFGPVRVFSLAPHMWRVASTLAGVAGLPKPNPSSRPGAFVSA